MSGAGNSFVIIDNRKSGLSLFFQKKKWDCPRIRNLCKSNKVDGLLLLENSRKADFKMRIFNPDGTEAEMCGNGIRCISYFAYKNGIVGKRKMKIETLAGIITTFVDGKFVKVKMTKPFDFKLNFEISVNGNKFSAHYVNTGVPHTILFVDRIDKIDVKKIGANIRFSEYFKPKGTNVDFVKVLDKNKIKIRTYERGVERETLACGTGATASALISNKIKGIKYPVKVVTKGGEIIISKEKSNIYMSGQVKEEK